MFSFAWWLSLTIGFLSLSEEILWVRVVGFAYQGQASAFSFVLVCYLVGIAFGAAYGKRLCARKKNLYGVAGVVLAVAALGDVLTPTIISRLMSTDSANLVVPALAIALTAGIKSTLFPIVHHLGSQAQGLRVGRSVSRIYFGNIVGATLGPLVTGFLALDHLSVDECFALAAAIDLLASAASVLKGTQPRLIVRTLIATAISLVVGALTIRSGPGSFAALAAEGPKAMIYYAANRHGIVHSAYALRGETVFGGNIYDGLPTVDVDRNPNRLDRVYILGLLAPRVQRVLVVGLASGAWLRAIQGFPGIEDIDVVEINPGYIELIRNRPQVAKVLDDPRIHIHIDDGRRWLKRHPQARYDMIVQNATFFWRANTGNLLSREYFGLIEEHLNQGGVFMTNTTGSFDVLATAQSTFPYAYRYCNFVYASDHPLNPNWDNLWNIRRPDGAKFSPDSESPHGVVAKLRASRFETVSDFLARHQVDAEVITDDNLLSEYRHGIRFGPAILQLLQPSPARTFSIDEP